jgi:hypothetical protein
MSEVRLASYARGLRAPVRLELSCDLSDRVGSRSFVINWLDRDGNILFHFNPRTDDGCVVLNSCVGQLWGEEMVIPECPLQERPSASRVRFCALHDRFRVFVDGRELCEFHHRADPLTITEVRCSRSVWLLEQEVAARPEPEGLHRGLARLPEIVPSAWADSWVTAAPGDRPEPLRSFRFFAVLHTWMEEDVVAATVTNCLRQGCERVYLVDNGSPDRTVERAVQAGALLADRYSSAEFLEVEKIRRMQAVVDEVSAAEGAAHAWWLWLDADEFHHGPGGATLREYLATLDRGFRVVGARVYEHFPAAEPAYVQGRHPLDFQPLCYERALLWYCAEGHLKHPLQRWDRDGPPIACGGGFHTAECANELVEPIVPVFLHHFPFRAEPSTRKRLERLFGLGGAASRAEADADATVDMRARLRSLDAVYGRKLHTLVLHPPCVPGFAPVLELFHRQLGTAVLAEARWRA